MSELADPDAPLVLADGTKIDRRGRIVKDKPKEYVEVPTNKKLQQQSVAVKKRLADLPAPPKQMNAVSVIVFYKLLGVADDEISEATGIAVEQVGQICMSELFGEIKQSIAQSILDQDADDVRAMFQQNARGLAKRLVDLADSEDEKVALGAINSGLDRAGLRPADVVEHRHRVEGGLTIEYIDREDGPATIDLEYEEVD